MSEERDEELERVLNRHRREIRLHCYRMLGSASDCEDLVQETFLRAWKARTTLRDLRGARAWLYRIATNACLDELARRPRRAMPFDVGPPADPASPIADASCEPMWLEPMPDAWLDTVTDPRDIHVRRETVALAFVVALHMLTPMQRAVLLLRDVAELSATETADALEVSPSAANSALHRGREAVREARDTVPVVDVDPDVISRYVKAFEHNDIDALVSLLREDVRTTMPPSPTWIEGRAANALFYRRMFTGLRPGAIRLVPTRANAQLAFGFYRAAAPGGPHHLRALEVITIASSQVIAIDHFMLPGLGELHALPSSLDS
jgi:RNA polymerase sigma-70 factor (ECF subfamily)